MPKSQRHPWVYEAEFPCDLDFIAPFRQFVSELAKLEGYSGKYLFRTEVIVDELCSNAILHGPSRPGKSVGLRAEFNNRGMEISVRDKGGSRKNLDSLKKAVAFSRQSGGRAGGRGLAIVHMLSSELNIDVAKNGSTLVRVLRARNDRTRRRSKRDASDA